MVDKISKETHFGSVKCTHKASDIAKKFMKKIVILHGLLKAIVSDRNAKFTYDFSKGLFQDLGNQLNFSTTYHS